MRANNVERILVMSFTNHTVDKTLEMLLDTGETSFVRLGGRSKHRRIADFALEKLEDDSKNPEDVNAKYKNMRTLEDRLRTIAEKMQSPISEEDIVVWLRKANPNHFQSLQNPPEHLTSPIRAQNPMSPTLSTSTCSLSCLTHGIKQRDIYLNWLKL